MEEKRFRPPHKPERQTAMCRSCASRAVSPPAPGHLIGTSISGWRRERRSTAEERTVWGKEKVTPSKAEGNDEVSRVDTTIDGGWNARASAVSENLLLGLDTGHDLEDM